MTIKEVSELTSLSADTLRYYERMHLIPPVPRTASGIRDYDKTSLNWIDFIKCMRSAGIPVEVLAHYVALSFEGAHTAPLRKKLLVEQRNLLQNRIADMQITLDRLNYKIEAYDKLLQPIENKLTAETQDKPHTSQEQPA